MGPATAPADPVETSPKTSRLTVLAGPTAVGKGTLTAWVREHHPEIWISVSATTRRRRPGETEGVHYRFVSEEEFDRLVADDELLEWAVVHQGARYGTPRRPVEEALAARGCFIPASLDRPVGEAGEMPLSELLGADDAGQDAAEARAVLGPLVSQLPERDRRVIELRFFAGLTQREIADDIGVTQMQVSRLLSRILRDLREDLGDTPAGEAQAS